VATLPRGCRAGGSDGFVPGRRDKAARCGWDGLRARRAARFSPKDHHVGNARVGYLESKERFLAVIAASATGYAIPVGRMVVPASGGWERNGPQVPRPVEQRHPDPHSRTSSFPGQAVPPEEPHPTPIAMLLGRASQPRSVVEEVADGEGERGTVKGDAVATQHRTVHRVTEDPPRGSRRCLPPAMRRPHARSRQVRVGVRRVGLVLLRCSAATILGMLPSGEAAPAPVPLWGLGSWHDRLADARRAQQLLHARRDGTRAVRPPIAASFTGYRNRVGR
jgi:hypothetical protein